MAGTNSRQIVRDGKLDTKELQRILTELQDKMLQALGQIGKNAKSDMSSNSNSSGSESVTPSAPILEETDPATKKPWLQQNYPLASGSGSSVAPHVCIRVKLPGDVHIELSNYVLGLALWNETIENASGGTGDGFYITQIVTSKNTTQGYADIHIDPTIVHMGDACHVMYVALGASGGYAETTYGDTERAFTAGSGLQYPEVPSITAVHVAPNHTKWRLTIDRTYDLTEPYNGEGAGCCNYYDKIVMYETSSAGATFGMTPDSNPEMAWDECDSVPLQGLIRRIKAYAKAHSGALGSNHKTFTVKHKKGETLVLSAKILQTDGQESASWWTGDTTGASSENDAPVITGVFGPLGSGPIESAEDDVPGGKLCDITMAVKYTGLATEIKVRAKSPNGTVREKSYDAPGPCPANGVLCYWESGFKRGHAIDISVRGINVDAKSVTANTPPNDTYDPWFFGGTVVAGLGAIDRPGAPTITSVDGVQGGTVVHVTLASTTDADKSAGTLQVWSAPKGTAAPTDYVPPGSAWTKIHETEVNDQIAGGNYTVDVSMNRPNAHLKALVARVDSIYDKTMKSAWSTVWDGDSASANAPGTLASVVSFTAALDAGDDGAGLKYTATAVLRFNAAAWTTGGTGIGATLIKAHVNTGVGNPGVWADVACDPDDPAETTDITIVWPATWKKNKNLYLDKVVAYNGADVTKNTGSPLASCTTQSSTVCSLSVDRTDYNLAGSFDTWTLTLGATNLARVRKIQCCKATGTGAWTDLNLARMKPHLDVVDPSAVPPACTQQVWDYDVPHQPNKNIYGWFRVVMDDLEKGAWTSKSGGATTYKIQGTITAGGVGLAGVTVSTTGTSASTDSNGTYIIPDLAPGTYTITPQLTGYTFTPTNASVTVTSADVTQNFTATVVSGTTYSISGTARLGATGTAGITVICNGKTATSGTGGAFTLSGFANGTYSVTGSYTGYTFNTVQVTISGANKTGVIVTGTAATGFTISGKVVTPQLAGVSVQVTLKNPYNVQIQSTTSDASTGAYSFANVPAGPYNYTVTPVNNSSGTQYSFTPSNTSLSSSGANVTGIDFQATAAAANYSVIGLDVSWDSDYAVFRCTVTLDSLAPNATFEVLVAPQGTASASLAGPVQQSVSVLTATSSALVSVNTYYAGAGQEYKLITQDGSYEFFARVIVGGTPSAYFHATHVQTAAPWTITYQVNSGYIRAMTQMLPGFKYFEVYYRASSTPTDPPPGGLWVEFNLQALGAQTTIGGVTWVYYSTGIPDGMGYHFAARAVHDDGFGGLAYGPWGYY